LRSIEERNSGVTAKTDLLAYNLNGFKVEAAQT
jgi:hypothetical protein